MPPRLCVRGDQPTARSMARRWYRPCSSLLGAKSQIRFLLGWIMWGNRKRKAQSKRGRLGAFLDEGSEVEGSYTCTGTVMLDGKLCGEITAQDTLIIGDRGVVEATVRAATLVVHGRVLGNVRATERVELKGSARVTGDVEAPVIVMEAGAVLDGQCRMTKEKPAEPSLSLVVPMKG
ncbi:MAG: polymer-forming cytoskeletal protein [Deltaproteobacteria bacterium]|nr:MAG: polymer-forming cytoskeletal protein [Deltaproteobacteria bacterium]